MLNKEIKAGTRFKIINGFDYYKSHANGANLNDTYTFTTNCVTNRWYSNMNPTYNSNKGVCIDIRDVEIINDELQYEIC